jgi:hypothetical protein
MVFEWGFVAISAISSVLSAPIYYFVNKLVYSRHEYTDLYAVDINDTYKIRYKLEPKKTYLIKAVIEVDKVNEEIFLIINDYEQGHFQKEIKVEDVSILYRTLGGYLYTYGSGFATIQLHIFDTSKML